MKTIHVNQQDNYKIIAISDIHAHADLFDSLYCRLDLKPEDYLIILGDFINKGPNSLRTIHQMMELSKRPNTYILKGNHEHFISYHIFNRDPLDSIFDFFKKYNWYSILHELCELEHLKFTFLNKKKRTLQLLYERYKAEFDFIDSLPVMLFFDNMIFVHGGYDESIDPFNDEEKLLKFDNYNEKSSINPSTVIVGHWPTANLRQHVYTNTPFFNSHKNIISIDGGVGVTVSGELNALIIEKKSGQTRTDYIQENHFIRKTVKRSHYFKPEEKFFINYPNLDIELVKKGSRMSKIRHLHSGNTVTVFNSLLHNIDTHPTIKTTYINHFINVDVGEEVLVCTEFEDCALIKYKGEFGWILKEQL